MVQLVAFNKFEDSQRQALEGLLGGETVEVTTVGGFFPPREKTSTADFALAAAAQVPTDAIVRNSGSYWGAAAIAAAVRGRNGAYVPIVAFGPYPFPVYRMEKPQTLRELGRSHRSGEGTVPEGPILVNLGHPLTEAQLAQAESLLGSAPTVVGVGAEGGPSKFHIDVEQELGPQVAVLIDALPVSGRAWQNGHVVVNLPGQAECAVLAIAYLEGLMGYIPSVFRVDGRKAGERDGRPVMEFDLTEVIWLQDLRNKAAEQAAAGVETISLPKATMALVAQYVNFAIQNGIAYNEEERLAIQALEASLK